MLAQVRDVTVRYGATTALDGIDLDLQAGEVHAVVGENGAGKSTLLRVVAGAVTPTHGSATVPAGVRRAWVPQETLLPPDLTGAEWVFLGCEIRGPLRTLQRQVMQRAAADALQAIGCTAAATARIGTLSVAQRKQLQLARALRDRPDVLLLDEPTAVLGERETQHLFASVRTLRDRGAGVLYVSHRLDEVLALADRVTVLRDGRHVSTDAVAATDTATLVHRMVGRSIPPLVPTGHTRETLALRLVGASVAHVREVSLEVRHGEVVGLAGLVGAGRSELIEAVAGLRRLHGGRIECTDTAVAVPEDRGNKGLVPTLALRANLFLPADGVVLRARTERVQAREWIERLRIHAPSTEASIASLSGGNQQKLLLARALRRQPRLLLLDEPTVGIDVGAKAEIHALIRQLARQGTAILLASSELPELLVLCDHIVALRNGRAVEVAPAHETTEARLAALITGADVRAGH